MNLQLAKAQSLLNQKQPNAAKARKILKTQTRRSKGDWMEYHFLGIAEMMLGNYTEAIKSLEKSIRKGSVQVETFHSLSYCEKQVGHIDQAIEYVKKALELNNEFFESWLHLGDLYRSQARLDEALKCYQRANQLDNKHDGVAFRIGKIYDDQGDRDKALKLYDIALQLNEDHIEARLHSGLVLTKVRRFEEALEHFKHLKKLKGAETSAQYGMAELEKERGDMDEAIRLYEKAIEQNPNMAAFYVNYALCLQDMCRFDESEAMYLKALEINPNQFESFSSYLMGLHYNPKKSKQEIYNEHLKWDQLFALNSEGRKAAQNKDPKKKIRLGMISGGFRRHPVGWMILGMLEYLDTDQFEVYLYSANNTVDSNTNKIFHFADSWKSVVGFNDEVIAQMIREDEVDILIELSGHSEDSKLRMITLEPAPINVKWVGGLFNTTGVSCMDYLITDHIESPEGSEKFYTEKLIRLPDDYICYTSPDYLPDVGELPYSKNGYITFGCFNNPTKINDEILDKWAELMTIHQGSKLFLKSKQYGSPSFRNRIKDIFSSRSISEDRLIFEAHSPHDELLEAYNQVDIALDPWPYSGGLTTLEALIMGVPVVTNPGPTFAGRHAATHLTNAGLSDFVAKNWEHYFEIINDLISDPEQLLSLRNTLRDTLERSPVMNKKRFTAHFEEGMRRIWKQYVENENLDVDADWKRNVDVPLSTDYESKKKRPSKERKFKYQTQVTDNGITIALPDKKESLSAYVYAEQSNWYDPEIGVLESLIQPGWNIWDIGACYGAFTLPAAQLAGEEGHVLAFEPLQSVRDYLEKSKKLNEYENITICRDALSDSIGNAKLNIAEVLEWTTLGSKGLPIRTTTLDRQLGEYQPDLIKIDIHGGELDVLKGAIKVLRDCDPVLIISLEESKDLQALQQLLSDQGYMVYQYLPAFKLLHPCEIADIAGNRNLIALKKGGLKESSLSSMIFQFNEHAAEYVRGNAWLRNLLGQKWIHAFVDNWKSTVRETEDPLFDEYMTALNLASEAEWIIQKEGDMHEAASKMLIASSMLSAVMEQIPQSLPVLFTMSRVLSRMDNRADTTFILQSVMNKLLVEKQEVNTDWPFLLPLPEMEEEEVQENDVQNWIKVKSLEGWLFTKEWSTWFLGEQEKVYLENLRGNGLVGERFHKIIGIRNNNTITKLSGKDNVSDKLKNSGGSTVTIGIPCYNEALYIEQCLSSVLNQKGNIEFSLVIADNCSNDGTVEIIKSFLDRNEHLKIRTKLILNSENSGQITTFSQVYEAADSEYFMWLGAHDCLTPDFLLETLPLIESDPECSMASGIPLGINYNHSYNETDKIQKVANASYNFTQSDSLIRYIESVKKLANCSVFHSIFRKKALEGYDFKDTPSSDHIIISRLLWHGKLLYSKAGYIRRYFPQETVNQKVVSGSYTKGLKFLNHYLEDFEYLIKGQFDEPRRSELSLVVKEFLVQRFGNPQVKGS